MPRQEAHRQSPTFLPVHTNNYKRSGKTVPVYLRAFALLTLLASVRPSPVFAQTFVWKLTDTVQVGGLRPAVLGTPLIVRHDSATALSFDGVDDALIVPLNPLQGGQRFTVEILFKPAADGPPAPRLIHGEDGEGNRFTVEARITPKGWYLDTFLKNGKTGKGLTLVDSTALHPCDRWHWAALVYDGAAMTHYVNAVKEKEGVVNFGPMATGQTAIGARLNRINWFKGEIAELRFGAVAVKPYALKRF